MAMHPSAQRRAQAELDNVVGTDRLPEFEDLRLLPFVQAIVLETLRWIPVLLFGVPHAVTEDDVYNEYLIPKGSMVITVSSLDMSLRNPF